MNLSLQVFEPEMSISTGFPKTRMEIERELGVKSTMSDPSKPLLLTLLEQFKYQGTGSLGNGPVYNPHGVVGETFNKQNEYGYIYL
jgi:hypothetical protein